jgi:hypothetical protein
MRSAAQMRRRILRDRAGLRRGSQNFHYDNMRGRLDRIEVGADQLHFDDGRSELNPEPIFNWWSIYG